MQVAFDVAPASAFCIRREIAEANREDGEELRRKGPFSTLVSIAMTEEDGRVTASHCRSVQPGTEQLSKSCSALAYFSSCSARALESGSI